MEGSVLQGQLLDSKYPQKVIPHLVIRTGFVWIGFLGRLPLPWEQDRPRAPQGGTKAKLSPVCSLHALLSSIR